MEPRPLLLCVPRHYIITGFDTRKNSSAEKRVTSASFLYVLPAGWHVFLLKWFRALSHIKKFREVASDV
jgi:hypothetical protein